MLLSNVLSSEVLKEFCFRNPGSSAKPTPWIIHWLKEEIDIKK